MSGRGVVIIPGLLLLGSDDYLARVCAGESAAEDPILAPLCEQGG